MKIALLQTGKTNDRNIASIQEDYAARIRKYVGFELITAADLKNTRNMPQPEQKAKEGKKILQLLGPEDFVILLDEKGREMRTVEFSDFLSKSMMMQKKRIVFVIGGAWGFSDEVYSRCDMRMSLSKMTFPHQLVRLLFIEQLYRAFTVIKGEPYHHE
ncbi:MAG TPA: 23S rRNA (pseudouridine(1915)-N(3))-methyltransferase RlmH [Bacteroidales bacterium]|nr:23S rRNA (pseudouridine(1915)-N(3))-methyltransferase RlmH [Bacteroidales bacterium]